jgi:predicted metal-dependent enzyme (double-stranded beta helix superfamily)
MNNQNWLVDNQGNCHQLSLPTLELPEQPYRLYRFLSEIEDLINNTPDNQAKIEQIIPRVRKLLTSSYWLALEFTPPEPEIGWSVNFLYDDYGFPLTIQMVAWLPGNVSPIHNHGTWGIVAIVEGKELNKFWRKTSNSPDSQEIELVGAKILSSGDIIAFLPSSIHSVEPVNSVKTEPTITFNFYGVTDYHQRWEFDPVRKTAQNF